MFVFLGVFSSFVSFLRYSRRTSKQKAFLFLVAALLLCGTRENVDFSRGLHNVSAKSYLIGGTGGPVFCSSAYCVGMIVDKYCGR